MIKLIKKLIKKTSAYKIFFIDKNVRKFIKFNKKKWLSQRPSKKPSKSLILIDLFDWYPFVYFFSYIANILSQKFDCNLRYFYFPLYKSKALKFKLSIYKIEKIFNSFNVKVGLNSFFFLKKKSKITQVKKIFINKILSKDDLVKYKYKNIKIGDLIYDSYLRANVSPTVDLKNPYLLKLFVDAHIYFDAIESYFRKNNVKITIVSHHVYIQYGLIARYAISKLIPVIQIHYLKFGQENFNLIRLDRYGLKDYPYYNYRAEFKKIERKQKQKKLLMGKKLIKNRIAGIKDYTSVYMTKNSFLDSKIKLKNVNNENKKIIIFSHNFYDSPHRHRFMIFPDFYEYIIFFSELSLKYSQIQWFIKPHPNDTASSDHIFDKIRLDFPSVNVLEKDISNKEILKLKPDLIITNHSTAGHEFAYFKIPVLNTGDNIHINYNFNIHARSKKDIVYYIENLKNLKNRLNFNKKYIYEFMYMHYVHYYNRFNRENLIGKNYFYNSRILSNKKIVENDSNLLDWYVKNDKKVSENIKKYIINFIDEEI